MQNETKPHLTLLDITRLWRKVAKEQGLDAGSVTMNTGCLCIEVHGIGCMTPLTDADRELTEEEFSERILLVVASILSAHAPRKEPT